MAAIVGVHGIAQQFRGGYQLASVWYDAVRDGLVAAGFRQAAEALAPSDLRVAFFGDLFRPQGAMGSSDPPFSAADIQPGSERDLLAELYAAAIEQELELEAPEGAMAIPGPASPAVMIDTLMRSRTFAGVAKRAMIGNLKQVSQFLADKTVKEQVLSRLHDDHEGDTKVLIGHSLGSVVAYEYLCRERPSSVELLVTLGSPLGIPNLIFDRLTPAPVRGAGEWPGPVQAWANVADARDTVALRKQLAGLFPAPPGIPAIADHLVDNGNQPHAADRYLNARQTGSVLGHALG
jgi:hypothetical protein